MMSQPDMSLQTTKTKKLLDQWYNRCINYVWFRSFADYRTANAARNASTRYFYWNGVWVVVLWASVAVCAGGDCSRHD